jgi:hypothetical protein
MGIMITFSLYLFTVSIRGRGWLVGSLIMVLLIREFHSIEKRTDALNIEITRKSVIFQPIFKLQQTFFPP